MPRGTRRFADKLQWAATLIPDAEVWALDDAGNRSVTFTTPAGRPCEIVGDTARCLVAVVDALITDPRFNGFGYSVTQVKMTILMEVGEIGPVRGLSGHELSILQRVSLHSLSRKGDSMAGVTLDDESKQWHWECPACGESSVQYDSRDLCREAYRLHRRELCGADEPPISKGSTMAPTTAPGAAKPRKRSKKPAKKATKAAAKKAVAKKAAAKKPARKPAAKKARKNVQGAKSIFRVALITNEKTGRESAVRLRMDGVPAGARYQDRFPKQSSWFEVEAASWAEATKLVRSGKATQVGK